MARDASGEDIEEVLVADIAPAAEVCARIEQLVTRFILGVSDDEGGAQDLDFDLVDRNARNGVYFGGAEAHEGGGPALHLLGGRRTVSLRSGNVRSYMRVWKVLERCYRLLSARKTCTLRELYYVLVSEAPAYFSNQSQVNEAVQDCVSLLHCTRQSLGIVAAGRGAVVGRLMIKERPTSRWIDCTQLGTSGMQISGDILRLEAYTFQSDARYILVVEKDAVFQRLSEDRFFMAVPSILITAKGFPDLATRAFLRLLHNSFPHMPIFILVDWNPAGLGIMCVYRFGSIRMALEASRYVCDVKWLGLRSEDLPQIGERGLQPLTARDRALIANMKVAPHIRNNQAYMEELERMEAEGMRAEIEALYAQGDNDLGQYITQKIVRGEYI